MWTYQRSRLKMTPRPIPCTHSYIVIESANKEPPTVTNFGAMISARCSGDGGGALPFCFPRSSCNMVTNYGIRKCMSK